MKSFQTKIYAMAAMLIALVIFAGLMRIALAPMVTYNRWQQQPVQNPSSSAYIDSSLFDPRLHLPVKEITYRQALLNLSATDSIQWVINLSDSSVCLSYRGVTLHRAKCTQVKKDRFLAQLSVPQQVAIGAQPIPLTPVLSTIVKEPIVVRQAPKNAEEAALNVWQPDTLVQNPAFVCFQLEKDIRLILRQNDPLNSSEKRIKRKFNRQLRRMNFMDSFNTFVRLQPKHLQPTLQLELPASDLRALYRGLPHAPMVVVKL